MLQRYNRYGWMDAAGRAVPHVASYLGKRAAQYVGRKKPTKAPKRPKFKRSGGISKTYDARSGMVAQPVRKSYRKKKALPLKQRISRLENKMADKYNYVLYLQDDVNQIVCAPGQSVYTTYTLLTATELNNVFQKIRVLQSDAGVQSEVDLDNTAVNPTLGIKASKTFHFRNNFSIPVKVEIYEYLCVDGTNSAPATYQSNTYTEYGLTSFLTDPKTNMNCPFDSVLKKFWRQKAHKTYRLNAGDEIEYHLATRQLDQTQQFWEQIDGNTYMKGLSKCIVVRTMGVVAHENLTTTTVGWGEGTLDVIGQIRMYGRMPGEGIKRIYEAGDGNTLTEPDVAGPNVVHINEAG